MEVQLHVDVRMRQKAGTQTTKIKSAKSFVMVHPRKFIPSKYTRYTVTDIVILRDKMLMNVSHEKTISTGMALIRSLQKCTHFTKIKY